MTTASSRPANHADVQAELTEQVIELQMTMAHLEMTVERLDQVITH